MIWALFALMSLTAIAFAVRPLLRDLPRLNILTGAAVVVIAAASAGTYYYMGSPDVPSGASVQPDAAEMVASLAARLQEQPDDVNGWKMLGRSYMVMRNFEGAINAYQRAVDLESAQNAQTLINLGVAHAQANGQQLTPIAVSIFENAITLEPTNPEGLFWSGLGAFTRGDADLAATRWELLLQNDLPPDIRPMIEQRVAEWRGQPFVSEAPASVVRASISLSDDARNALPANAVVFVIARDPAQPSPPIAVARRQLSELPSIVELGDRDAMVPGRTLSGFAEIELLARVSVSGQPSAQPGDWFGSQIVRPAELSDIEISIDEQVQ